MKFMTKVKSLIYNWKHCFKLEPFPPNSNPFHYDAYHMGNRVGKNIMVMYKGTQNDDYLIIVNTKTGERLLIDLE